MLRRPPFWVATTILVLASLLSWEVSLHHMLLYNDTESMPGGYYLVYPAFQVRSGQTVVVCLPHSIASRGMHDGYLRKGLCEDGSEPIVKVALRDATVRVLSDQVCVDGRILNDSDRVTRDENGHPISSIGAGTYRVSGDRIWLASPFGGAWDSRYFGSVPVSSIRGVAVHLGRQPSVTMSSPCPGKEEG